MVFCGKPSKACLDCRVNRRRCDLSKPSCGQCLRTGSFCRGYRDEVELAFRDQSQQVIRRAQSSGNPSKRVISSKSNISSANSKSSRQKRVTPAVNQSMDKQIDHALRFGITSPIEVQATPFFIHHYLLRDLAPPIDDIDCLATIYGRASEDYLASIINAIGIASLSNLRREPHLMHDAGRNYMLALRGIRAGLAQPTQATSDQMLVGIMLLNVYETVTSINMTGLRPWKSHMHGALTMLELRGKDQLKSQVGRKLFLELRTEVLYSCLESSTPVPQVILDWMSEDQKYETGEGFFSSHLASIIASICALGDTTKTYYRSGAVSKADTSIHISEALAIDADLVKWSTTVSVSYDFLTLVATKPEESYLGLYHRYSGLRIAQIWNLYRCARIFLHKILTNLLSFYPQATSIVPLTPLNGCSLQSSEAVIYECAVNICLSAPFILNSCQKEIDIRSESRAACGASLLRPLFLVGAACPGEQSMREWARFQLHKIEGMTGIKTAGMLALMM